MAWTAPTTRATGDLITASIWNTDLVNNLIALRTHIGARVYHNATQSLTTGVAAYLAMNTESWDTDVIHDNATNNSRLTCKTAGKYKVIAQVAFAANGTGVRYAAIVRNQTTAYALDRTAGLASDSATVTAVADVDLAVNDYVEVQAFQNSGGALNVLAGPGGGCDFSMHFIGT